jgi:thiosulfate/3-mercaptopyruvate sulfurtransferase
VSSPLVDPRWLAAHLDDPRVIVADVRWYLGGKRGADEYARGHIPGAFFVDLDHDLASPPTPMSGRHPLPDPARFASVLARMGVGDDSLVVAYDDAGGAMAARLWWLLGFFGRGGGRVLDGGIDAWRAAGGASSTDVPPTRSQQPTLALVAGARRVVDKVAVDALRRLEGALLLDARAPERYEGKVEPIDARPGHIPGARSAPFAANLTPEGRFRAPTELAERYRALGALEAKNVVCYCGSGVTACHDVLALALAGREDVALYAGSWSEWARDPALPAALGPDVAAPGGSRPQ